MIGRIGLSALLLSAILGMQDAAGGRGFPNQATAPGTVSSEVRDACKTASAIAAKTPGVTIRPDTGVFSNEALREPVLGCRLAISGSFARAKAGGDAASRLREGFAALGWQELPEYDADGKDGTAFAVRKAAVACLVRGEWNGGADGEPEIPREDWYRVSVLCTSPVPAGPRKQAGHTLSLTQINTAPYGW